MRVLMRVEVRDTHARVQRAADLRVELEFDLRGVDASRRQPHEERRVALRQTTLGRQGPQRLATQQRPLLDKREVNADVETGPTPRRRTGFVESRAAGHEGRRGHNAFLVALDHAPVHGFVEPEVVGAHDQPTRHARGLRATRRTCGVA